MDRRDKNDMHEQGPEGAEFAARVGTRIRAIRSRRGLTRKNLAFHSRISERYLAQVEGGTANISMSLLARVAGALSVRVGSLLPPEEGTVIKYEQLEELIVSLSRHEQQQAYAMLLDRFTAKAPKRKGVALVGLRGAGKSTLGAGLAKYFKVPFIRLDELTSQLSGTMILQSWKRAAA